MNRILMCCSGRGVIQRIIPSFAWEGLKKTSNNSIFGVPTEIPSAIESGAVCVSVGPPGSCV
jgi:hypothetical protein